MISLQTYTLLKEHIAYVLPLNEVVIYSLPEGLWVFCITLTSKPYYIRINKQKVDCMFIPLVFCFTLELLQLFHITKGRFDFMDIGISVIFWLLGTYVSDDEPEKQNIVARLDAKKIAFVASYCIVYLSHVL